MVNDDMDMSLAFSELFDILKKHQFENNGSYLSVDVSGSDLTVSKLQDVASFCNYNSPSTFTRPRNGTLKINVNLKDGSFKAGKVFFSDYNELFLLNKNTGKLPDYFFTLKEKESSFDAGKSHSLVVIEAYFAWRELLSILADHQDKSKSIYVFFISKDGIAKKYTVNASVDFETLVSITSPKVCFETANHFIDLLTRENDAHQDERKSVMRSTLSELIDNNKESTYFLSILNNGEGFTKKYKELYELYIHRFSINNLLNEIDAKSLEYLGKTNELISSLQTKALAIPGGLIAIGAFSKASDFLSLVAVFSGFMIATWMTEKSNEVHRGTLGLIEEQVVQAFDKYIKDNEEKEVESAAINSKKNIVNLIGKGVERLDSIDKISKYSMYGAAIYMLFKWLG